MTRTTRQWFTTFLLLLALLVPAGLQAAEGKYLGGGWFSKVFWDGGKTVTKITNQQIAGSLDGSSPVRGISEEARRLISRRTVQGIEVLRKAGMAIPETRLDADGLTIHQEYVPFEESVSFDRLPFRQKLKAVRIMGQHMLRAARLIRAGSDGSAVSQVTIDPNPINFRFVLQGGKIAKTIWYDPIVPLPGKVFSRLLLESGARRLGAHKPQGVWTEADISVKPGARWVGLRRQLPPHRP